MAAGAIKPEDIKITKKELLDTYRKTDPKNPSNSLVIPEWFPQKGNVLETIEKYRSLIAGILQKPDIEQLSEVAKIPVTALDPSSSRAQIQALGQLDALSKFNDIAGDKVVTVSKIQDEINRWRVRSDSLPMTPQDKEYIGKSLDTISRKTNNLPANASINLRDEELQKAWGTLNFFNQRLDEYSAVDEAKRELGAQYKQNRAASQQRSQAVKAAKEAQEKKEREAEEQEVNTLKDAVQKDEEEQKTKAAAFEKAKEGNPETTLEEAIILTPEDRLNETAPVVANATGSEPVTKTVDGTPPDIQNLSYNQTKTGELFTGKVKAKDDSGGPVFYSIVDDETDTEVEYSINPITGVISSDQPINTPGQHKVTVSATDSSGNTTTREFLYKVKLGVDLEDSIEKEEEISDRKQPSTNQEDSEAKQQAQEEQPTTKAPTIDDELDELRKKISEPQVQDESKKREGSIFESSNSDLSGLSRKEKKFFLEKRKQDAKKKKEQKKKEKRERDLDLLGGGLGNAIGSARRQRNKGIKETREAAAKKLFQDIINKPSASGVVATLIKGNRPPPTQYSREIGRWAALKFKSGSIQVSTNARDYIKQTQKYIALKGWKDTTVGNIKTSLKNGKYTGPTIQKYKRIKTFGSKLKKKKQQSSGLASFAGYIIKRIVGQAIEYVETGIEYTKDVGRGIRNTVRNAPLIRQSVDYLANTNTARYVSQKYTGAKQVVGNGVRWSGGKLVRVYDTGKGAVKVVATGAGRIAKAGIGTARVLGTVAKSTPYGALTAAAGALIVGTSSPILIPVAATGFALGTGITAANDLLGARNLSQIKAIRNIQIKHGWGQLFNQQGGMFAEAAKTKQGRYITFTGRKGLYSRLGGGLRIANSALSMGSVFAIGGTLLGVNPIAAALVGATVGGGGRFVIDKVRGGAIRALMETNKLPGWAKALAKLPTAVLVDQTMSNIWVGDQIKKFKYKYGSNFGEFVKNEYGGIFKLGNDPMGAFIAGTNYLGAAGYIFATANTSKFLIAPITAKITSNLLIRRFGVDGLIRAFRGPNFTNPIAIGAAIGTVLGIAIASAFGVPLGTGALIGATIGSGIGWAASGVLIGTTGIIGAITGGAGWAATPAVIALTATITTVTTAIGTWIGSIFDRQVSKLTNISLQALNSLTSLFALLGLLRTGFNMDQLIPLTFSIITISGALHKGGVLFSNNECLPQNEECTGINPLAQEGTNQNQPYELDLAHYGVTLISQDNTAWNHENVSNILTVLAELGPNFFNDLGYEKGIYIAVGENGSYYDESFALIGLDPSLFNNSKNLEATLKTNFKEIAAQRNVEIAQYKN